MANQIIKWQFNVLVDYQVIKQVVVRRVDQFSAMEWMYRNYPRRDGFEVELNNYWR